MEQKKEEHLLTDDTAKYQDSYLDGIFMSTINDVCEAILEAGYEPFDQLTGYVRTGNDQYITRRHNARKIVTEMDIEDIWQYLKRYGHRCVTRK